MINAVRRQVRHRALVGSRSPGKNDVAGTDVVLAEVCGGDRGARRQAREITRGGGSETGGQGQGGDIGGIGGVFVRGFHVRPEVRLALNEVHPRSHGRELRHLQASPGCRNAVQVLAVHAAFAWYEFPGKVQDPIP